MTNQEIHGICVKYSITNYTINPDGSIDVNGNVLLINYKLTQSPLKFNKVSHQFNISYNNLTSLEGCPKEVVSSFECSNNNLTSLEGLPKIIKGSLFCTNNKLINLKGIETVDRFIFCGGNPLESLEGFNLNYDKLDCDNKDGLILKSKRKQKLKILEKL